mmetsp:Transcript_45759/g.99397  ORF Transcript_45759/g.99397 Transcript_45759/m.99397 type:complete len:319 (+) Transcript_45759:562-1518(+)
MHHNHQPNASLDAATQLGGNSSLDEGHCITGQQWVCRAGLQQRRDGLERSQQKIKDRPPREHRPVIGGSAAKVGQHVLQGVGFRVNLQVHIGVVTQCVTESPAVRRECRKIEQETKNCIAHMKKIVSQTKHSVEHHPTGDRELVAALLAGGVALLGHRDETGCPAHETRNPNGLSRLCGTSDTVPGLMHSAAQGCIKSIVFESKNRLELLALPHFVARHVLLCLGNVNMVGLEPFGHIHPFGLSNPHLPPGMGLDKPTQVIQLPPNTPQIRGQPRAPGPISLRLLLHPYTNLRPFDGVLAAGQGRPPRKVGDSHGRAA